MCHHVDKVDLVEEFLDMLADDLEDVSVEKKRRLNGSQDGDLKPKSSLPQLVAHGDEEVEVLEPDKLELVKMTDKELVAFEREVENRAGRLKASKKYFGTFADRLVEAIGAKMLNPGRLSALSTKEEETRVKCSWRDFDAVLWLACFGEPDQLAKLVANPVEFQSCRHQLVIGFSDQIPVWVKIGRSKQVYCEKEVRKRMSSKDFKASQDKTALAPKNKSEKEEAVEEAVELKQIVVVDPNQGLDTEGLEQEEKEVEESTGFGFEKSFP